VAESTESSERTRRAGRGLIAIAGVKAYHIFTGYGIAVLLPRILGSPELFGLYSKVMAAIGIINNVLVVATLQSVSKFVSENEENGPSVLRRFLGLQLGVGVIVAGAVFLSAPLIADFHNDDGLTPLFRVVSVIPLSYAIYAVTVGYLNGRQRFQHEARLDTTFYTIRTLAILGAAALLGWGALAPILGAAVAAVVIAVVALVVVGTGEGSGEEPAYRRWIAFMAPLGLYHLFLNGILELDVQVLAKTVSELALASGEPPQIANAIANTHVGFYHAAQSFAFVPYSLMLAMTFIVFPMISRATSTGDEKEARRTIRQAMRVSLLALLSVAAPLAGAADGVMRLAFPEEYLAGAPALEILSVGIVAFALFVVAGTILTSAGRPVLTAVIAAVGLAVTVAGNYLFVSRVGIGEDTLAAAALGTSLGMGVVFLLAGGAVYARFETLLPPASVLRGGAAAVGGFAVASWVPHQTRPMAVVALIAGFATYLLVLFVLREITASDLSAAKQILGRKKTPPND
jgi:stage V sporulation protein B